MMSAKSAILLRGILLLAELKALYLAVNIQLSTISGRLVIPGLYEKFVWGMPHKILGQAMSLHEHRVSGLALG